MDRRRLPFDGTVALRSLHGRVDAASFTDGTPACLAVTMADLTRTPEGGVDKTVLYGQSVIVIRQLEDHAFVQCAADGYCGYLSRKALGQPRPPSHRVVARGSHLYARPDMKSDMRMPLSFGSLVTIRDWDGDFGQTPDGWIPRQHVRPLADPGTDPVAYAELLLGTPYLWGGNSSWGIDCSGLVQAAFHACALPCPRDSDMQRAELGADLPSGATLQRGDLIFWKGHVGLMADGVTLIHANAHHMCAAREPLDSALARIAAQEFGEVIARKRVQSG